MDEIKIIKVWFLGFDPKDGDPLDFSLFNHMSVKSKFKLVKSNNPDFVFYQPFFNIEDLLLFPNAVKIFITGEPLHADLNFFDYCFCFDNDFDSDRVCFYPHFLWEKKNVEKLSYEEAKVILGKKNKFCDFIYGHEIEGDIRKHYFDLLSTYRYVDSAGKYLNNQIGNKVVHYEFNNNSKYLFQKKCKFSLCIQWVDFPWFINEKIYHSLYANQIPIFYGTNKVKQIFNSDRILCISDYKSK